MTRHPGCRRDHVLLGDPALDEAVGMAEEEVAPRRIQLAAGGDVRPERELHEEGGPDVDEPPDVGGPRAHARVRPEHADPRNEPNQDLHRLGVQVVEHHRQAPGGERQPQR